MFHRFRHQILIPVVIMWMVLTITGLVMREVVWNRLTHSLEASGTATQLEGSLNQLFSDLQDAETSQRGYLLTGNESYLEPFRDSELSLNNGFDQIAVTAAQDPVLVDDLVKLRGLTEVKMQEMKDTIKLRHDKGLKEAMAVVNSNKGKEAMDQIRKVNWEMRQRQLNIFSTAWANTRQNLQWAQTAGLILGVSGLGTGLLALYLVRMGFLQERARRQLLEEKMGAEKIVMEKSAFLANMSHEIRTPMNAILGFGELLEGESLNAKQTQYVRAIRESGKSLLQLINDVLDLSKMEAGKLELHLEPTDLRELFNFLQTMFGQQASTKMLQLRLQVEPMPRALLLDRLRLRQVLVNLVGNAMKFTAKGHVTVRAAWEPHVEDGSRGDLTLEVSDTGVGISPEMQQAIFKPFVQSVPHRDLEHQGTGLGLSIVHRLMQMMDGTITLESKPDAGSLFRLKFKNVAVSARLPVSDLAEPDGDLNFNDLTPSTLLVVDDNQTNRDLITGLFQGTHHRLLLAGNGREALARIAEVKPTLVLMDIRMPVMDGRATLAAIRRLPGLELLPVLAVTASSHANDERDLRERFNGYLRKPFSRRQLYQELAQFLPRVPRRQPVVSPEPAQGTGIAVMATARSAATPEAAMNELKLLHQMQWPGLRDGMGINETTAFARRLRRIAQTIQSESLMLYADRLAANAQAYAVGELERNLAEFPALINSIQPPEKKN